MNPRFLIGLALLMLLAGAAYAQQAQDARLLALEEKIQALQSGQDGLPKNDFHLTGYASMSYNDKEGQPSSFGSSFNPLFLFKAGERFLFEAELEFGFGDKRSETFHIHAEEDASGEQVLDDEGNTIPDLTGYKQEEEVQTEVQLEYAQVDYFLANNLALVAGKFLLPFGSFGERGHPTWINKLPSAPPIYGGHHGGFAGGIIPVLSDFGVQVRGGATLGGSQFNYAVYLVNGPRPKEEVEVGEVHGHGHGAEMPVDWAASPEDNNNNKAMGFRVGYLPFPAGEVGLSYYSADAGVDQDITLTMVDVSLQLAGFDIRSEFLMQDTSELAPAHSDSGGHDHSDVPDETTGYYVQVSYGWDGPEAVFRFGSVETNEAAVGTQTAIGFNYWLESSLVVKLAVVSDDIEGEEDTELTYMAQLAHGF